MMRKKSDASDVRLCDKLCVNFHFVAVKNTSCAIRHLAKFKPTGSSIK